MRNSRIVSSTIALILVCLFIGGGLSLSSAEPTNNISSTLQSGKLTRGVSSNDGFTLEPDEGYVGTEVKIAPPRGGGSSGADGNFTQVDAFGDFALALGVDGLIYSWGDNTYGQLGIGTTGGNRNTPQSVQTPAGVKFKEISAGQWHSVALDTDGNIWSWGRNNYGQLGIHNFDDKNKPQLVPDRNGNINSTKFKKVSAGGMHSAALDTSGHVWAWGCNERGQLGIGYFNKAQWQITETKPFKEKNGNVHTATDIDCGGEHTLAVDEDLYLWGWGRNEEYQLGLNPDYNNDLAEPTSNRRPGWAKIKQISAGGYHSIIVAYGGMAAGVGSNSCAQAGNMAQLHWDAAWRIPNARDIIAATLVPFTDKREVDGNSQEWSPDPYGEAKFASAGYTHSLGIAKNGNKDKRLTAFYNWGWGCNAKGQIGSNSTTNYNRDVQAYPAQFGKYSERDQLSSNFQSMAAGRNFSVGLSNDNKIYTWGINDMGQLGDGSDSSSNRSNPATIKAVQSPEKPYEILDVKFDGANAPLKRKDASSGAWFVDAPQPNHTIGSNNLPVDVLVTYKDANGVQKTTILRYTYLAKQSPNPPPVDKDCRVSFDLGGAPGAAPAPQIVKCGSLAKWPDNANPKWSKHWFNGWKVSGSKLEEFWDFNKPVMSDMNLIAQWESYEFDMTPRRGPTSGGTDVTVTRTPGGREGLVYMSVSSGKSHTVAVGSDGYVYAWGQNVSGQLGDGTKDTRSVAVRVKAPANVRFLQVSAGGEHSLALDSNGDVWGWGQNAHGQVGDQSTLLRTKPIQVSRMSAGSVRFTEVSAGGEHSLALDSNGDAWSWGYNANGILGLGTSGTDEWHPVKVSGGVKFAHVSAGYYHSAGVDVNGEVWSWGRNSHGQLGNQSTTDEWHPVKTARKVNDKPGEDSTGVIYKSVSAGNDFTVALANDGQAWSWGRNDHGQLGNNWITDEWHPIKPHDGDNKFKEVSAGGCHVLALRTDDWAFAWGCNTNGRLGLSDQPSIDQWKPSGMGIGYVRHVSAGDVHSAVVVFDRQKLKTWGDSSPQLGRDDPVKGTARIADTIIQPFVDLTAVTFDRSDGTSLTRVSKSGDATGKWTLKTPPHAKGFVDVTFHWTVGDNDVKRTYYEYYEPPAKVHFDLNGASGSFPDQLVPDGETIKWPADNPTREKQWFNGWATDDGKFWDFNDPLQSDNPNIKNGVLTLKAQWEEYKFTLDPHKGPDTGNTEVTVTSKPGGREGLVYMSVSSGKSHTVAVGSDGYVYAWGQNVSGQLGDGTKDTRSVAVRVKAPANVRFLQVSAGGEHSLALDSNGDVWGWGQNAHGQVGDQSTLLRTKPIQVSRMSAGSVRFTEVSAGGEHSLALDSNGDAWSWGYNANGILGLGTSGTDEWHPVKVSGGVKFAHVSAGYYHSAGVDVNGEVWSWGRNSHGQLGNQSTTDEWHPVKTARKVNDKPGEDSTGVIYKSVSAGNDFTVALANDGQAWSWGRNDHGQLGNNWITDEWHPIKPHDGDNKFKEVSAGGCHVLALRTDDWAFAWGCNTNGRLGLSDQPSIDQWKPSGMGIGYVRHVSAGDVHSAVVVFDRQKLKTWGDSSPQLGRDDPVKGTARIADTIIQPFVDLTAVTFDRSDGTSLTRVSKSGDATGKWTLKTPPHVPDTVDVILHWTVGGDIQDDYIFSKNKDIHKDPDAGFLYYASRGVALPKAGAIPLARIAGVTLLILSSLAGLVLTSRRYIHSWLAGKQDKQ